MKARELHTAVVAVVVSAVGLVVALVGLGIVKWRLREEAALEAAVRELPPAPPQLVVADEG